MATRRGTRTASCLRIAIQVDRKVHANVGTATVQVEEDDGVIAMTERTATADAITAGTLLSAAGMTAPFATRTRKVTARTHVNAAQVSSPRECISHAWCTITENAGLENFQVVIGDGAERPPSNDEMY